MLSVCNIVTEMITTTLSGEGNVMYAQCFSALGGTQDHSRVYVML